jgi:medium-chain acyl-[acyl-carrier-protein] hydrolase
MTAAVDGLRGQVAMLGPVALYGHSMGALLAFELARALETAGREPLHLFVSGRRAPHLPPRRPPTHHLPEQELIAALDAMGTVGAPYRSPAFLRYAVLLLKADLELSEEYEHRPEPRLRCPVTAFHGTDDPVVDADEADAWRIVTTGPFAVHAFVGDHFFHQRHRRTITAVMADALGVSRAASRDPGRPRRP